MSEPAASATVLLWSVEVAGLGGERRRMLVPAPTADLAEATALGWWMADHGGAGPTKIEKPTQATPVDRKAWEGRVDWASRAHRRGKASAPSPSSVQLREALKDQPGSAPELVEARDRPDAWIRSPDRKLRGMIRGSAGWWSLATVLGLLVYVALAGWPIFLRVTLLAVHVARGGELWFDSDLFRWFGPWWIMLSIFWVPAFLIGTEQWVDGFLQRPYQAREHRSKIRGPMR